MRTANVFLNGIHAGVLTERASDDYSFEYNEAYLLDPKSPPISLTFPKTQPVYQAKFLFPFFYNMLSEGVNRKLQSRLLQIDENDSFGLLLATAGKDTIGAITVKPV